MLALYAHTVRAFLWGFTSCLSVAEMPWRWRRAAGRHVAHLAPNRDSACFLWPKTLWSKPAGKMFPLITSHDTDIFINTHFWWSTEQGAFLPSLGVWFKNIKMLRSGVGDDLIVTLCYFKACFSHRSLQKCRVNVSHSSWTKYSQTSVLTWVFLVQFRRSGASKYPPTLFTNGC